MNLTQDMLKIGLERGFIDCSIDAEEPYIPRFLVNDPDLGEKVISSIKKEMSVCNEFMFSVAFVTYDGINALLNEFRHLTEKGVRGRMMVSQYQNFTQPKALRKLMEMSNVDLRIVTEDQMKMHSKCYIFRKGNGYDVIIGSSNLTNNALCSNGEWNILFNSTESGQVIQSIVDEFEKVYEHATPVTPDWLTIYDSIYDETRNEREAVSMGHIPDIGRRIEPNVMQAEALRSLAKIRADGGKRALVISATGSGKTYLAAFDAKIHGGRVLYLVHRRSIRDNAKDSFRNVFGTGPRMLVLDQSNIDTDCECLFSTVQAISSSDVLNRIPADRFDYILIDEVHHAGAPSYQRILSHFKPKFMLGMTATPDRTDGYDIYSLFDHNIAYEIRLKEALEYSLICPFHYFGISELDIDGEIVNDKTAFGEVEMEERVDHILRETSYYGYSGRRLKGLVFCRGLEEAEMLSTLFNRKGLRTAWVSGEMDPNHVETLIERLESDEGDYSLDYIFTADLFNEGVDIPSVNQIVMLRPTQSPIVYIQQLGRGLRLHKDKDFLVVLDFIGNYEKNYCIPLALSDDHSYNKIEARRFIASGDSMVFGNSTISFDEITKKRIYESIDNADFSTKKMLKDEYLNLRFKLDRIPNLTDFRSHGTVDALKYIYEWKSYHAFLKVADRDYDTVLSEKQEKYLAWISSLIATGKRLLELELMESLIEGCNDIKEFVRRIRPDIDDNRMNNIIAVFDGSFYRNDIKLIENNATSSEFLEMTKNPGFKHHLDNVIALGKENNHLYYNQTYAETDFVLNRLYSYRDVCRLGNWPQDVNGQNIGGYKYDSATNSFVVFINYEKDETVIESQRYEDRFENRNTLIAISKSNEGRNSKNIIRVKDHIKNGMTIHLFIRKNKNDKGSKEFYYLGMMDFVEFLNDKTPVEIRYRLRDAVRSDIYDYLTS